MLKRKKAASLQRLRRRMITRPPRVFISSALRGLEEERSALYELITQDLGWEAWCFERDGESQVLASLRVCLNEIEKSDLYLCLLGEHYGTMLDIEGISFTEQEYQHACYCFYQGKLSDIKIYIRARRNGDSQQDDRLSQFIHVITDPHVGHFSNHFENCEELVYKARKDLIDWSQSPSRPIQLFLQELLLGDSVIDGLNLNQSFSRTQGSKSHVNLNEIAEALESLSRLRARQSYSSIVTKGLEIWDRMRDDTLRIRIPPVRKRDKFLLEAWANLLTHLTDALNPYGYAHVTLPLSKALLQIHKMLGNTVSYYSAAHLIANTFYITGNFNLAEKWDAFAIDRLLQHPGSHASELDGRGSILRATGNILAAENCFKQALYTAQSETMKGLALSHLGELKLDQSRNSRERARGERYLQQAIEWTRPESLANIRTRRNWAKYLIRIGAYEDAKREVRQSLEIAHRYELQDQLKRYLKPLAFELDIDLEGVDKHA